jgi:hypothetical protein
MRAGPRVSTSKTQQRLLLLCLLVFLAIKTAEQFSPPWRSPRFGNSSSRKASSASASLNALKFDGTGTAEVTVSLPPGAPPERSLPAFLRSSDSDGLLLGSASYQKVSSQEGNLVWEVSQPPIEWFGTKLMSTFINRIDRPAEQNKIVVAIEEARTEIATSDDSGNRASLMSNIMGRSSFTGGTELTWQQGGETSNEWSLRADIRLDLAVNVPKFLPLPPGFNSIGSQIVGSTCKIRIQQNLQDIKDAYLKWGGDDNGKSIAEEDDTSAKAPGLVEDSGLSLKQQRIKSGTLDAYLLP